MNWRTDKPTADVIVIEWGSKTGCDPHKGYDILRRYQDKYYLWTPFGERDIPFEYIEKWADLEEDEKERQEKPNAHEGSWEGFITISSQDKDMNIEEIAQQYVDNAKTLYDTPTWDFVHTAVVYGYQYVKDIMEEDEGTICPQKDELPKWKVADRDVRFVGEPQFLIKTMQDGGDHSDYEVVEVSDTILKGDKYIDLYDLERFLLNREDESQADKKAVKEITKTVSKSIKEQVQKAIDENETVTDIELIKKAWYRQGYIDGEYKMEPQWVLENLQYKENPKYGQPLETVTDCNELEDEIEKCWKDWLSPAKGVLPKREFMMHARHFAKWGAEHTFTHHEVDESLQEAVTHQMEDDQVVDDYVRKGLDEVCLKYAELGAKWGAEHLKK